MKRNAYPFCRLALLMLALSQGLTAQRYREGDLVENFSLVNRATNLPVSLADFEGKIVFLEWFAYWCPFCQAAAEQVETGIVDYYKSRNGNAHGVPVMHVGINLEGGNEPLSQQFINRFGMELVLNDFDASLANRFQPGGQPIFAIINGTANASSHQQWELVYSRLGYGDTTHPITEFRNAIDSVQAAPQVEPPFIEANPQPARIGTGSTLTLSVSAIGQDLSYQWSKDGSPIANETNAQLQIPTSTEADSGSYSVQVSNAGGQVTSAPAELEVVRSLADFLSDAGLSGHDLAPEADPDRDGFPNALEYLAQSHPNSFSQRPNARLEVIEVDKIPTIRIQFESSSDTIGYRLAAHFWSYPASAGNATQPLPLGSNTLIAQAIPSGAKTYLARLAAIPTP
ncbi:immunoglobulin domain-containing protein [Pelagicoccus sp. NFK12]|uniref:Immunoglobulin domain-containing protein n=1 Tax=Pelagicoccus enzymogenes TaxID=2773457 RepID=A0A927F9M6_9BACT|nr:immunoglobulin domain-containing protein [Pelagicoccus enzymogenes]MBD5780281.1 immunoglobulin domain-containing protein [Pelagicoccus enzymogenes]